LTRVLGLDTYRSDSQAHRFSVLNVEVAKAIDAGDDEPPGRVQVFRMLIWEVTSAQAAISCTSHCDLNASRHLPHVVIQITSGHQ